MRELKPGESAVLAEFDAACKEFSLSSFQAKLYMMSFLRSELAKGNDSVAIRDWVAGFAIGRKATKQ